MGVVYCAFHEATSLGLVGHCNGIAATYASDSLRRVWADTPQLLSVPAAMLPDPEAGALIAPNASTLFWALSMAKAAALNDLCIAGFGSG